MKSDRVHNSRTAQFPTLLIISYNSEYFNQLKISEIIKEGVENIYMKQTWTNLQVVSMKKNKDYLPVGKNNKAYSCPRD